MKYYGMFFIIVFNRFAIIDVMDMDVLNVYFDDE